MLLTSNSSPKFGAINRLAQAVALALLTSAFVSAYAFDSGSTGADGPLNVTTDTVLTLPASGIFNFTDVVIADGATLTFEKNPANTPVYILASGDVTVAGTIDLRGESAEGAADERRGGAGGPGGYDGGGGGFLGAGTDDDGGAGQGPGGGNPGTVRDGAIGQGGGGGGYRSVGGSGERNGGVAGGEVYGSNYLIPLIGGSGGGGGSSNNSTFGGGGGGGGGAILIAASGTVDILGSILATGGRGGNTNIVSSDPGAGGGGSGGAIRIVATTLEGSGVINAAGGSYVSLGTSRGGAGAPGRIRLEAENFLRPNATNPAFSGAAPNPVFVASLPGLTISSVAGIPAPSSPTGFNDIVLPETIANPLAIEFSTNGIPLGSVIELTATPQIGNAVVAMSSTIGGSLESGNASATIDLPNGSNILIATTTFEVTAGLQKDFSRYAMGEQIEKVKVSWVPGSGSVTTFFTAVGNEYAWTGNTLIN